MQPVPAPQPSVVIPRGVYLNHNRESAIAFKNSDGGVWYLTFIGGRVDTKHMGVEKFRREFPHELRGYPILRAIRIYETSTFPRDERTEKVLRALKRL